MEQFENIRNNLGKALDYYSKGEMQKHFIEAKRLYFSLTGMIDQDSDEYEAKMNCFNDWFLFNYKFQGKEKSFIEEYAQDCDMDSELFDAFSKFRYSIFEFRKISFRKQIILDDLLHKKKYALAKKHHSLGLIEGDIFIGRLVPLHGHYYMLDGVCVLPNGFKSHYLKQAKVVRKLKNPEKEVELLTKLEALKSKWVRYGRIDIDKIFIF